MKRAGTEACLKHRSSGSGVRRRGKSIWTSRIKKQERFSSWALEKRSFLLDRERPVFFSLAREKKMGGSNLDQPLRMAVSPPRRSRVLRRSKTAQSSPEDFFLEAFFKGFFSFTSAVTFAVEDRLLAAADRVRFFASPPAGGSASCAEAAGSAFFAGR